MPRPPWIDSWRWKQSRIDGEEMPPLDPSEIRPGLVARLDTAVLRETGGSQTNATTSETEDRAVMGVHDFLVLAVDTTQEMCTAVPLFPKTAPGSSPLDPRKRRGDVAGWATEPAFYSHWQHWRIPHVAFVRASSTDPGAPDARRSYATSSADTLQDIANWATRNRNPFRPL